MISIISKKRLEMLELRSGGWERVDDFLSQSDLHWLFFPIRQHLHGLMNADFAMYDIRKGLEEYLDFKSNRVRDLALEVEKLQEENRALRKVIEIKKGEL